MAQVAGFAGTRLDISDFPTRHPYGLGLWQIHIERLLAEWVGELDVQFHRGRDVTGFAQDAAGVDVELADGPSLRAEYLVGCDGGRSVVRKAAGIEFPGWEPTTSFLIAEVELAEEPEWGMRKDATGIHGFSRLEDGPVRVMVTEQHLGGAGEATLATSARGSGRCRDRLRRPQPHVDLAVHRHGAGRRRPTATGGCCWPATRRTCTTRWAARDSTSACRTP